MIYTLLAAFAITCLTQVIKSFVFPKWGATGVHVLVFVLALIGAGVGFLISVYPTIASFVQHALELLSGAVAIYEIILKKIGDSSATDTTVPDAAVDTNSTAFSG